MKNPLELFSEWYQEAQKIGLHNPNAVVLATVSAALQPNCRVVLLKHFDEAGFVFFTNYGSAKGQELFTNPRAALLFYWDALDRQVRVQGKVERISRKESAKYFATRSRGSQLSAWASAQSQEIPSREFLLARRKELELKFAGRDVPLPDQWGGFRLTPARFEFWTNGEDRLHDRTVYVRGDSTAGASAAAGANGIWKQSRLAP